MIDDMSTEAVAETTWPQLLAPPRRTPRQSPGRSKAASVAPAPFAPLPQRNPGRARPAPSLRRPVSRCTLLLLVSTRLNGRFQPSGCLRPKPAQPREAPYDQWSGRQPGGTWNHRGTSYGREKLFPCTFPRSGRPRLRSLRPAYLVQQATGGRSNVAGGPVRASHVLMERHLFALIDDAPDNDDPFTVLPAPLGFLAREGNVVVDCRS